jgi:hypothetical protein
MTNDKSQITNQMNCNYSVHSIQQSCKASIIIIHHHHPSSSPVRNVTGSSIAVPKSSQRHLPGEGRICLKSYSSPIKYIANTTINPETQGM